MKNCACNYSYRAVPLHTRGSIEEIQALVKKAPPLKVLGTGWFPLLLPTPKEQLIWLGPLNKIRRPLD